jgi:hypothetical protein
MGENILPCKFCGQLFRDKDLVGGGDNNVACRLCLDKFEMFDLNYLRVRHIAKKMLVVVDRDNEITPDFYGEIFFDIMMLGKIEDSDKKRYFTYSLKEAEKKLNEFLETKKNGK